MIIMQCLKLRNCLLLLPKLKTRIAPKSSLSFTSFLNDDLPKNKILLPNSNANNLRGKIDQASQLKQLPSPSSYFSASRGSVDTFLRKHSDKFHFYNWFQVDPSANSGLKKFQLYISSDPKCDKPSEIMSVVNSQLLDKELSLKELITCLWLACSVKYPYLVIHMQPLMTHLDSCSVQMLRTCELEDSYRLASLWFQFNLRFGIKQESNFLLKFVNENARSESQFLNLDTSHFLFFLFMCGSVRSLPAVHKHVPLDATFGYKIPVFLSDRLEEILPSMDPEDASIIAESLHKLHIGVLKDSKLSYIFAEKLLSIPDEKVSKSANWIMCLAKALQNSLLRPDLKSQIMIKFLPHLPALPMDTKVRLISLLDKANHAACQRYIKRLATTSDFDDLQNIQIKHLYKVVEAMVMLNFSHGKNGEIIQKILEICGQIEKDRIKESKHYIAVVALAMRVGIFQQSQLDEIFKQVNSYLGDVLRAKSHENMYLISHNICNKLTIHSHLKRPPERLKDNMRTMMLALYNIGEIDGLIQIQCPDYKGLRLNPEIRRKFLSLLPDKDPDGRYMDSMKKILKDLQYLLGRNIFFIYLTPISRKRFITFCLDPTKKPLSTLPVNLNEEDFRLDVRHAPNEAGCQWFALNMERYVLSRGPSKLANDKRLSELLGYTTIIVNAFAYQKSADNNNSQEYLLSLIEKYLRK